MINTTSQNSNVAWTRCATPSKPTETINENNESLYQRLDREPSLSRQMDMQDAYYGRFDQIV